MYSQQGVPWTSSGLLSEVILPREHVLVGHATSTLRTGCFGKENKKTSELKYFYQDNFCNQHKLSCLQRIKWRTRQTVWHQASIDMERCLAWLVRAWDLFSCLHLGVTEIAVDGNTSTDTESSGYHCLGWLACISGGMMLSWTCSLSKCTGVGMFMI